MADNCVHTCEQTFFKRTSPLHYTNYGKYCVPHRLGEWGNYSCTQSSCVLVYIVGHLIGLPMVITHICQHYLPNQWWAIEDLQLSHVAKVYFTLVMMSIQILSHKLRIKYNIPPNSNMLCSMRCRWLLIFSKEKKNLSSTKRPTMTWIMSSSWIDNILWLVTIGEICPYRPWTIVAVQKEPSL